MADVQVETLVLDPPEDSFIIYVLSLFRTLAVMALHIFLSLITPNYFKLLPHLLIPDLLSITPTLNKLLTVSL